MEGHLAGRSARRTQLFVQGTCVRVPTGDRPVVRDDALRRRELPRGEPELQHDRREHPGSAAARPPRSPPPPAPPAPPAQPPPRPGHVGAAFLELQLYPPGYPPFIQKVSCDRIHWCAA